MSAASVQFQGRERVLWVWSKTTAWLPELYAWLWWAVTAWAGELQAYLRLAPRAWLGELKNVQERARWTTNHAPRAIRVVADLTASTGQLHLHRRTRWAQHQVAHATPWLIGIAVVVALSFVLTRLS